jgi:adenylate kinase
MSSVNVIILLGPPGVGKGTQASLLVKELKAIHLSTGNLIRAQIQAKTPLGLEAKRVVDSGQLIDDTLITAFVDDFIKQMPKDAPYLIIDGIPRNEAQITLLTNVLQKYDLKVGYVLALEAQLDKLLSRFSSRFMCSKCHETFALKDQGSKEGFTCTKCGAKGSLVRRKDDEEETVRHRFEVYQAETLPVISHYRASGLFHSINGLLTAEVVHEHIKDILKKSKKLS